MPDDDLVMIWIASVERVTRDDWTSLADWSMLDSEVRGDSSMWLERFLSPAADPEERSGVDHSIHVATDETSDLLRHEYEVDSRTVVVTEQRNFALVEIPDPEFDPAGPDETAKQATVNRIAQHLLNMAGGRKKLEFKFAGPLVEGSRFSTNTHADPFALRDWSERVDGGVRNGRLWFLFFKKQPQRVGYEDSQDWFSENLRNHFAAP